MEQILSRRNLNAAYLQVVRNKGAAGIDGMTVEELGAYLSENGENIREQLRTRKYRPQPVRRVEIPKPDGGVRNLGVPTVVDRFVQQAVAQVLTPIFEEQFHNHSYGFRPGRCAQQAVLKALEMMNDGHSWIVDIDLAKFFDTVDHDKLMTIFGRTIKDGDVISVVRKFLVSGVMIDDEYEDTVVGTPQGGNISPLLANIMLNELDWELEARGLDFVRYADDLIIMVGSRQAADRVMKSVTRFIEGKLGLKVNATKSKVDKPKGIKYLGFGFYFDSFAKAYKARPHPKAVAKFKAQMRKLTCRSWGVSNVYKVQKLNQLIASAVIILAAAIGPQLLFNSRSLLRQAFCKKSANLVDIIVDGSAEFIYCNLQHSVLTDQRICPGIVCYAHHSMHVFRDRSLQHLLEMFRLAFQILTEPFPAVFIQEDISVI